MGVSEQVQKACQYVAHLLLAESQSCSVGAAGMHRRDWREG
jgi:hypothetical protein